MLASMHISLQAKLINTPLLFAICYNLACLLYLYFYGSYFSVVNLYMNIAMNNGSVMIFYDVIFYEIKFSITELQCIILLIITYRSR